MEIPKQNSDRFAQRFPSSLANPAKSPLILNTAIALPDFVHSQEEIRGILAQWLAGRPGLAEKTDAILTNALVERRYSVRPAAWYMKHTSVTERSEVYREEMARLCERAATEALTGAGVAPEEVDLIISTSCTGMMIPSVEHHLMNRMPFGQYTRRQPITEMGCVAGALAISHADDFLRGRPESAVLVVSAELTTLTAQVEDFSMANVISAALFGDGAAATVIAGDRFAACGNGTTPALANGRRLPARIVATRSVFFPDSLDVMGFDNTDTGLKIVMLPKVPRFVREQVPKHLPPFLEEQGLRLPELTHYLLHPGGRKVLEGLEKKLSLTRKQTRISWEVLQNYGNLSSTTVLYVLHQFEREVRPRPGEYGLMMAVGPGFSAEFLLLQW